MKSTKYIFSLGLLFLLAFYDSNGQNYYFKITTTPENANIYLNNTLVGVTPFKGSLKFSFKDFFKYELKIKKEGYATVVYNYTEKEKPISKSGDEGDIVIKENLERLRNKFDSVDKVVVTYDKMIFDIKPGAKIGEQKVMGSHYPITWKGSYEEETGEFNKLAEDELEHAGFMVVRQNKLFASAKVEKEPELLIGSTLKDVTVNYQSKMGKPIVHLETILKIEWQVFNVKKNKVIATATTEGNSLIQEGEIVEGFHEAFKDAMIKLMFDKSIVSAVKELHTKTASKAQKGLSLPAVVAPGYKDYSSMVTNSVKSVVTVKFEGGHGSGFFISSDGFMLTNYHVVNKSKEIEVVLSEGFSLPAEVWSYDEDFDLALIKVKGSGFKPLFLKNDDSAGVGNEVVAIGTPLDVSFGQSVSKGIISGSRELDNKKYYQTDANVNPGNSGGPLLNNKGEVIAIVSRSSSVVGYAGVSLAIPITVAIEKLGITFK